MPTAEKLTVEVGDITLSKASGEDLALASLGRVQVVVLLRHRH